MKPIQPFAAFLLVSLGVSFLFHFPSLSFTHFQFEYKRWRVGQQQVYDLHFSSDEVSNTRAFQTLFSGKHTSKIKTAQTQESAAQEHSQVNLNAKLVETVIRSDAQNTVISYQYELKSFESWKEGVQEPDFEQSSNPGSSIPLSKEKLLQEAFKSPVYVTSNSYGSILTVAFDPAVGIYAHSLIRSLLMTTQWSLSEQTPVLGFPCKSAPSPQGWETVEEDSYGRYRAQYTCSVGPLPTVLKEKMHYVAQTGGNRFFKKAFRFRVKPMQKVLFSFNPSDKGLSALEGEEREEVSLLRQPFLERTKKVSLIREGYSRISGRKLSQLQTAFDHSQGSFVLKTLRDVQTEDQAFLSGAGNHPGIGPRPESRKKPNWEKLKIQMRKVFKNWDDASEISESDPLFLKFRLALIQEPRLIQNVKTEVSALNPSDEKFRFLVGVLGSLTGASSQAAESALRDLLADRAEDPEVALSLLPSLVMREGASIETEDLVKRLASYASDENVRSMAGLSLGILAKQLFDEEGNQDSQVRGEAIFRETVKRLEETEDESQQQYYLAMLGNMGSQGQVEVGQRYLNSPTDETRAGALKALRFVPGEGAESALVEAIEKEPSDAVRAQAAYALGFRESTKSLADRQIAALTVEKSPLVIQSLLKNLGDLSEDFPEAGAALKLFAQQNPQPELRQMAEQILQMNAD